MKLLFVFCIALLLPWLSNAQLAELACEAVSDYELIIKEALEGMPAQGIREYRDEAGQRILILDHDKQKILYRREDRAIGYTMHNGRWKPAHLLYLPAFPGSPVEMDALFAKAFAYPEEARKAQATGEVIVSAVVTEHGTLTALAVERDIGYGCGEAVMTAMQHFPQYWLPAHNGSRPVRSKVYFAVECTLDPLPDFVSPGHTPVHSSGMGHANQKPALNFFRSYTVNRASEDRAELSRT